MQPKSDIVLPYEPGYTGHREAAKREQETREWLRRREQLMKLPASPALPDAEETRNAV